MTILGVWQRVFAEAAIEEFMARQAFRKLAAEQDKAWCRWDQGPEFHLWHWHSLRSVCGIDVRQVYRSGIRIQEPPSHERDRCDQCARLVAQR